MKKDVIRVSTVGMTEAEWQEARMHSIGGSDAAAIVGLSAYVSPYTVWADKLGKIPPSEDNEAMRQGRDLEQYVAERFAEATGKKVRRENNILINPDFPFAHANVDRIVIGEDAGLECKTTNQLNLKKFKNGEFPDHYYVQCMHYMMVTGCSKWYLAVLVLGREFMWFEIERDEEEIAALDDSEKAEYLETLGLTESGLDKLITASYDLLGLMSFLTAGESETSAWTIKKGTKAPRAAGKIHSDFERGFIRAEVINYQDLLDCGSLAAAREKGLVRSEGKEYVVQDGDTILFRFNV